MLMPALPFATLLACFDVRVNFDIKEQIDYSRRVVCLSKDILAVGLTAFGIIPHQVSDWNVYKMKATV